MKKFLPLEDVLKSDLYYLEIAKFVSSDKHFNLDLIINIKMGDTSVYDHKDTKNESDYLRQINLFMIYTDENFFKIQKDKFEWYRLKNSNYYIDDWIIIRKLKIMQNIFICAESIWSWTKKDCELGKQFNVKRLRKMILLV